MRRHVLLCAALSLGVGCSSENAPAPPQDASTSSDAVAGDALAPSDGGSAADAIGSACATQADCVMPLSCAFTTAAGCVATGRCLDLRVGPGVGTCVPPVTACGCDGQDEQSFPCFRGDFPAPVAHLGSCAADAAAD